jgi:hypothetical protein
VLTARRFATLALLVAFAACAGNATPRTSSYTGSSGNERSNVRPADRVVEGVIKVDSWSVPAHERWAVGEKGLVVYAKHAITIDGILEVPAGRRIALFAPELRIRSSGMITTAELSRYFGVSALPEVADVIDACDLSVGSRSQNSSSLPIVLPPGDSLEVSASAKDCTFQLYQWVETFDGRNGNRDSADLRDGETGGNIEIGTETAIGFAERAATEIGEKGVKAYMPHVLELEGVIAAGDGGAGADDVDGKFTHANDTWSFAAGSAGRGGNVAIDASKLVSNIQQPRIVAGRGGNGGGIGAAQIGGIPTAPNAGNLNITQSRGDDGGSVFLSGAMSRAGLPPILVPGNGGDAGVVSASGGSGWSAPAGKGGNVTLALSVPGAGGTGAKGGVRGTDGSYPTMIFSGSTGGSGGTGAGSTGGSFYLIREHFTPPLPATETYQLQFTGFGSGGASGSTCGHLGYLGGAAGNLYEKTWDGRSDFARFLIIGFNGGAGGPGDPGGTGGNEGNFILNGHVEQAIGTVGSQGYTCF